uniref:DUF4939 domain-containing protein n=1 Tax=Terrapene triunguis TaxID=2587831 RepID=A0A674I183_9SAUR
QRRKQEVVCGLLVWCLGPKIPLPECFDGSCQQFWSFINQCHHLFLTCPQTYNSDLSNVSLPISLLMREALDWASPLLENDSLVLLNRNAFLQSMSVILDDLH